MSLPEVLLWQHLKGSPGGVQFRKQHPIGDYQILPRPRRLLHRTAP